MARRIKLKFNEGAEIRAFRTKRKLTQADFWERVGITQSGGSRYESGRRIPEDMLLLMNLIWGERAHAEQLLHALRKDAQQCVDANQAVNQAEARIKPYIA